MTISWFPVDMVASIGCLSWYAPCSFDMTAIIVATLAVTTSTSAHAPGGVTWMGVVLHADHSSLGTSSTIAVLGAVHMVHWSPSDS